MNKLRLDKFLNMGYKLVTGDKITKLTGDTLTVAKSNLTIYNNPKHYGTDRRFIHSLCELDMSNIIEIIEGSSISKKQGKTVVEAIFALGCDIEVDNSDCIIYMNDLFQVHDFGHWMQFIVCSGTEFNQYVKDMSRHNTSFETFNRYLDSNTPLEPVKPRTKVEYVKVIDSIFHLQPDLLAGELYTKYMNDEWKQISDENLFARLFDIGQLYRKVETEIKTEKRWLVYNGEGEFCSEHDYEYEPSWASYQVIEITVDV